MIERPCEVLSGGGLSSVSDGTGSKTSIWSFAAPLVFHSHRTCRSSVSIPFRLPFRFGIEALFSPATGVASGPRILHFASAERGLLTTPHVNPHNLHRSCTRNQAGCKTAISGTFLDYADRSFAVGLLRCAREGLR